LLLQQSAVADLFIGIWRGGYFFWVCPYSFLKHIVAIVVMWTMCAVKKNAGVVVQIFLSFGGNDVQQRGYTAMMPKIPASPLYLQQAILEEAVKQ